MPLSMQEFRIAGRSGAALLDRIHSQRLGDGSWCELLLVTHLLQYPSGSTVCQGSTMQRPAISRPEAALELALWQAEADATSSSDIYVRLRESGLPPEVAIRLKELMAVTKRVGDKLISLGKVIVMKLIEFIQKHPHMAIGIALAAAISVVVAGIPYIGQFLAPIVAVIGIPIGAIAGHRMDKAANGVIDGGLGVIQLTQDVIEIAREFFQLFIDTLSALSAEFTARVA